MNWEQYSWFVSPKVDKDEWLCLLKRFYKEPRFGCGYSMRWVRCTLSRWHLFDPPRRKFFLCSTMTRDPISTLHWSFHQDKKQTSILSSTRIPSDFKSYITSLNSFSWTISFDRFPSSPHRRKSITEVRPVTWLIQQIVPNEDVPSTFITKLSSSTFTRCTATRFVAYHCTLQVNCTSLDSLHLLAGPMHYSTPRTRLYNRRVLGDTENALSRDSVSAFLFRPARNMNHFFLFYPGTLIILLSHV